MRAMVATLLDHFHLSIDDYASLTDRQIVNLYFHPRKKDGIIEIPPPNRKGTAVKERSYAEELAALNQMLSVLRLDSSKAEEARKKLAAKFGVNNEVIDGQ